MAFRLVSQQFFPLEDTKLTKWDGIAEAKAQTVLRNWFLDSRLQRDPKSKAPGSPSLPMPKRRRIGVEDSQDPEKGLSGEGRRRNRIPPSEGTSGWAGTELPPVDGAGAGAAGEELAGGLMGPGKERWKKVTGWWMGLGLVMREMSWAQINGRQGSRGGSGGRGWSLTNLKGSMVASSASGRSWRGGCG